VEGYAGRDVLFAYLESMRPIAQGDVPDPGLARRRIADAFNAFLPYDADLRVRAGLPPRVANRWR
jgi:hypothetical protein